MFEVKVLGFCLVFQNLWLREEIRHKSHNKIICYFPWKRKAPALLLQQTTTACSTWCMTSKPKSSSPEQFPAGQQWLTDTSGKQSKGTWIPLASGLMGEGAVFSKSAF